GHAEAGVRPERVVVPGAVVHPAVTAPAVPGDAVATVDLLVVVPGLRHAVLRVHGDRGAVAQLAVAPLVVGVGEQRAGAGGAVAQVGRVAAAALRIRQVVGAARLR